MAELPPYAYLPGTGMPHPTRHPAGHSYGKAETGDWQHGLRLFRAGYYWEAHEAWEALWREAEGLEEQRLRGMIQLAAALLKKKCGQQRGAASLWAKSRARLSLRLEPWRGLDLAEVVERCDRFWRDEAGSALRI